MSAIGDYLTCFKIANSMVETYKVKAVRFFSPLADGLAL
jgi:hypothetical protein